MIFIDAPLPPKSLPRTPRWEFHPGLSHRLIDRRHHHCGGGAEGVRTEGRVKRVRGGSPPQPGLDVGGSLLLG